MAQRIGLFIKLAYAAPALALAAIGIPVYVYIPKFYTDVVGVNVATVGTLLMVARVFDAFTDPAIGLLSDRTASRWGRRRPYIAIGAIPLAAAFYLTFAPPMLEPVAASAWLGATLFTLFLFWTVVTVPYEALGPELSYDYDERTSVLGLRDGALLFGTLLAAASPAIVAAFVGDDERTIMGSVGLVYAPFIVAACWWCAVAVPEAASRRTDAQTKPRTAGAQIREGLSALRANRPFAILLAAYTVAAFGSNLPATLILYYVNYVLGADNAEIYLLLYFATGIVLLPAWVKLAAHTEKKTAWLAAMTVNTTAFAGVYFLGRGDTTAYAALVCLSGVGFGATVAIPSSMQADVIDYDELTTGERSEGRYIGIWSIARKLAAAAGVGIGLQALGWSGYQPGRAQDPVVVETLKVLYALVPCLCNAASIAIAWHYPITREKHREIRIAVQARAKGEAADDPLA